MANWRRGVSGTSYHLDPSNWRLDNSQTHAGIRKGLRGKGEAARRLSNVLRSVMIY
jgi:hypothetical protein